jgi:hypothetical protein
MSSVVNNSTAPTEEADVREPSSELFRKVQEYVEERGMIYAPIEHPAFAGFPSRWSPRRLDQIAAHIEPGPGTALDIGSHWGHIAHYLEDRGYTVTACESSPRHLYFLTAIRDLCGKKFEVYPGSIFTLPDPDFDLVMALNIFHHFLKSDERFYNLEAFLGRLKCRTMIYQAHRPKDKPKLDGAGHYMEAPEMAEFIARKLSLPKVEQIGDENGRGIFKISS